MYDVQPTRATDATAEKEEYNMGFMLAFIDFITCAQRNATQPKIVC